MNLGFVGGIIGGALGVLGGAIGTYFSIKNTSGPRERAFLIRISIVIVGRVNSVCARSARVAETI